LASFALGLLPLLYLPLRGSDGRRVRRRGIGAAFLGPARSILVLCDWSRLRGRLLLLHQHVAPICFLESVLKLLPTIYSTSNLTGWVLRGLALLGACAWWLKTGNSPSYCSGRDCLHTPCHAGYRAPQTVEYLIQVYCAAGDDVVGYSGFSRWAESRNTQLVTRDVLRGACAVAIEPRLFISHFPSRYQMAPRGMKTRAPTPQICSAPHRRMRSAV